MAAAPAIGEGQLDGMGMGSSSFPPSYVYQAVHGHRSLGVAVQPW